MDDYHFFLFSLSFSLSRLLKASASANGNEGSDGQARLEAIEEEETVRMHLTALKREEVAQLASPSVLFALLCTMVASARVHDDKRQSLLAD